MAASMTVLAPMMTGMGGDAFLLFYEAETGHVRGMNGAGRASHSVAIEKLRSRGVKEMPERGALTVTVPGAVRLWEDAANTLGNLPLARLLEPAWELAEEGYPVSELVARYWEVSETLLLPASSSTRRTSRGRLLPSLKMGPMLFIPARSLGASLVPYEKLAVTWTKRTSRLTRPSG
jgi:gamma-glutamyltranspeptidase/glutathione hydrolase